MRINKNSIFYHCLLLSTSSLVLQLLGFGYRILLGRLAGAQAIEQVTGKEALIKWVNDIYCEGKKVSGILTEGAIDMESGCFEHAVLGIGVNVQSPEDGFPAALAEVAGAICDDGRGAVRSELAARILVHFPELDQPIESRSF